MTTGQVPNEHLSPTQEYWVSAWMREHGIRSSRDLDRLLAEKAKWKTVFNAAELALTRPIHSARHERSSVLAAQPLDLSPIDCFSPQHRLAVARPTFATLWLYFDAIIVQGLPPERFVYFLRREAFFGLALRMFEVYVQQVLYLRRQGALKHLLFRARISSIDAYNTHAASLGKELGLDLCLRRLFENPSIEDLVSRGRLELLNDRIAGTKLNHNIYSFTHPSLDHEWPVGIGSDEPEPSLRNIARMIYLQHYGALLADHAQAREFGVPLVAVPDPILNLGATGGETVAASVANLNLPFIAGVPMKRIFELREDYPEEFDRFKYALTLAIREATGRGTVGDGRAIGERVTREYLAPALADIRRRLRAAKKATAVKVAQNALIGASAVDVGLALSLPLLVAAGVAGIAASVTHLNKLVDEKKDISLNDLFFLWRVSREEGRG